MDKAARSANSSTALFALSAFFRQLHQFRSGIHCVSGGIFGFFYFTVNIGRKRGFFIFGGFSGVFGSVTLLSTLAESAVTLSSAALAAALASAVSCARLSTRVFTAVTSSLTFSMDSESSDEALEISLSTSVKFEEMSSPILVTDLFRSFTPWQLRQYEYH